MATTAAPLRRKVQAQPGSQVSRSEMVRGCLSCHAAPKPRREEVVSKSLHSSLLFLSGKTQCFTSSFIQGCTMAEMTLNTGISTLVAEGDNIRDIDFESARP